MWKRGASRSSALDKAMAQLAAKRAASVAGGSQTNDNAPLQANSSLNRMLPARQIHFQDLSDISSEDVYSEHNEDSVVPPSKIMEDDEPSNRSVLGGGCRFLKKPTNIGHRQSSAPAGSQGLSMEESAGTPQRRSQSAALSRLAQLEERFRHRKEVGQAQTTSHGPPSPPEAPLSAHSSSDLSMKGARFLKKREISSVPETAAKSPPTRIDRKGLDLDSDEEDMKMLLDGALSSSAESPKPTEKSFKKSPEKKSPFRRRIPLPPSSEVASPVHSLRSASVVYSPSPSPPHIQSSSRRSPKGRILRPSRSSASVNNDIKSLEELFTDNDDTLSERSAVSDVFKLNVLTLDDLVPAEPLGLHASSKEKIHLEAVEDTSERSLDDIFPEEKRSAAAEAAVEYESDFESDIQSEATYQSVSEIPENLTDDDQEPEPAGNEDSERHHLHSLSHRDTDTLSDRSVASRSETDSRKTFESYNSRTKDSSSRSYSSYSRSDTLTPTNKPHRKNVKEAAVQTEEKRKALNWQSEMDILASTYMDPTPVIHYKVSEDALEALTSQKPVEAAFNDMLKQQLALTRHFIESSRHLYSSLVQSLEPPDYKYTTLEDTIKYIQKHRPPTLTMEEALEEVHREMREYHYL
ncbi:hypothetical protein ACEWY4_014511 [Coilia grayii]|uniref:DUF4614 domain-containing protein n=1 Tax=Coilia grayii TaxID=363190 RepID=A0ABD1JSQ8_9TELE